MSLGNSLFWFGVGFVSVCAPIVYAERASITNTRETAPFPARADRTVEQFIAKCTLIFNPQCHFRHEQKSNSETSHDFSESPASLGSSRGMFAAAWFNRQQRGERSGNEPYGNSRDVYQDDE